MMKMNKEKFLKTEFGAELKDTICTWDKAIKKKTECIRYSAAYSLEKKMQKSWFSVWLMQDLARSLSNTKGICKSDLFCHNF